MADPLDWLRGLLGGGDPEAAGAAAASTAMGPNVLQYAQDVLSGRMAASGPAGQNAAYDPQRSFRENALRPDGLEAAMSMVGPAAIRAFHGSPYNFSRFDMSKIGTGEGAQAYGHGLYFAEAEPVAESYLRTPDWRYGRTKAQTIYDRLSDQSNERGLDNAAWDRLNAQRGFWEKVVLGRSPRSIIDDAVTNPGEYGPAELAYIQSLDPTKFKRTGGHMYEVDINADPQRLLDWDKPLGAQPAELQQAMSRVIGPGSHAQDRGQTLYDMISNAYDKRFFTGGRAEASQALADAGIPGIRYLDQGSRGTGQGTSNYVVFDDKLINILRKYGILPPLAAGAAGAAGGIGGLGGSSE